MAKYTVTGEGETIEVLGVLRQAGEVLSLLEKDAQPEVERGVLTPVVEEVVAEPTSTEPPTDGNVGVVTPETVGGGVETANTETVVAQPTGDVVPTTEPVVATETATGTDPVTTVPVQQ